jgi:hypothetical protein
MYLPAVVEEAAARRYLADEAGGQISVTTTLLVYQPGILGLASLRFTDRKWGVDEQVERMLLAEPEAGPTGYDWEHAEPISVHNRDLLRSAERVEEGQGPYFMPAPEGASTGKKLAAAGSELADYLYYKSTLKINIHEQLDLAQGPREDDRAFRIRLQQAARERRDAEVDKLAKQAATQIDRLTDKITKAQQKLSETQQQAQAKQTEQWINIGESVVSMFMGRRSSRAVSSAASKWNQASRAAAEVEETKQALADMEAEVKGLEADLKARTDEITAQWDQTLDNITTTEIKLRRTDVNVEATMLGWAPFWRITYNDGVRDRTTNVPAHHLPEVG